MIRKVIDGEELIRQIVPAADNLRLRVHASIARIEAPKEFIAELAVYHGEIAAGLKKPGFQFATLDLEGFRSGSMDHIENNNQQEILSCHSDLRKSFLSRSSS